MSRGRVLASVLCALGGNGCLQFPHHRRRSAPSARRVRQGARDRSAAALPEADRHHVDRPGQTARRPPTYLGEPRPARRVLRPASSARSRRRAAKAIELNFENTPVTGVVKVVLGDILQLGYLIDPRVQGTITLASGRPVPQQRSALRAGERAALERRLAGARQARLHRDAVHRGGRHRRASKPRRAPSPGSASRSCRCSTSRPTTLSKLLDSFAVKPGTVRVDPARNLVLMQGSGADRRNAVETVLSFDADWMRGQSVGIYPGAQQRARADHRRTRAHHGFGRRRPEPEPGEAAADRAAQRHHGRHQQARAAARPRRPGSPVSTSPTPPRPA